MRKTSVRARRRITRARRRDGPGDVPTRLLDEYRETRDNLRFAIREAKARVWEEMISSLDDNPWGRPYKLVLNRLKLWTSPRTETLDPQVFDNVLGTLFPEPRQVAIEGAWRGAQNRPPWTEDLDRGRSSTRP